MTGRSARAARCPVSAASCSPGDPLASSDVSLRRPDPARNGPGSGKPIAGLLGYVYGFGLRQAGDELVNRLAAAGVERDLDPGVQPGLGSAQVAHQVDEPVQFVGLEGEDPLVVVE